MKIALFSDIHANLPALEAFFKEVEMRAAEQLEPPSAEQSEPAPAGQLEPLLRDQIW